LRALFASNLEGKQAVAPEAAADRTATEEAKAQAPYWRYLLLAAAACLVLEVLLRDWW